MNGRIKKQIQGHIDLCLKNGMKDANSIYQNVVDNVVSALCNRETEEFVSDYLRE